MTRNLSRNATLCAAILVCCLILPHEVGAQVSTASVNGTVRDSAGAVIPDAQIVLRNVDTGIEHRSATNVTGNYVILNIQPGNYTLEALKEGFAAKKLSPFALAVNQTASLDFALTLGAVQQTVTVEAIGAEVQSSTAELGAVITRQQVNDLPLNGRNFTQLLTLTPGAAPVSVGQNSGGAQSRPVGQFTFPAINGAPNRSNLFMLDGANNQGVHMSTYAVPPIVDAIQEFKVQSHNDQAEFGGVLGGIVNVVTKQGTNGLHGTLWEYLRNDAFDARGYFVPRVSPFKQHMFGVTAGGPVVLPKLYDGRNRTFFFLGYQGFRFRRPAQSFFNVPTAANLTGDLSDQSRQIFDPLTTRDNPGRPGTFLRDPFSGNRIPASRLDPGMVLFARSTLPEPMNTGRSGFNALDTTPFRHNQDEYTTRIDQYFGAKDSVWFRYSGTLQTRLGGRQHLENGIEGRAKNLGASWVHTFGPSSVLQAQFARSRMRDETYNTFRGVPADFATAAGFSDNFAGNFVGGRTEVPALNVADYFSGGESFQSMIPTDVWQARANYSIIRGNHTLKFGGEFNKSDFQNVIALATANFVAFQTSDPLSPGNTGSSLASFLLNVPDAATRRNIHESVGFGGVVGFYFQDQWKATSRLTLNIGLRYDKSYMPPYGSPADFSDETGNMDFNRGIYVLQKASPSCAERQTAPCIPTAGGALPDHVEVSPNGRIYRGTSRNFQPRFGLAYRLTSRTAFRASFGVFFDNWSAVNQMARNFGGAWPSVGFIQASNLNRPVPGQLLPAKTAANPLPAGILPANSPFTQVAWFADPNIANPYSLQWNGGIQHQLNGSTVITANYVGSGSRRLDIGGFYNTALTPGPGNPQERALYPYIRATNYDRSWGRGNYHSFQFLLDKKFSGGLAGMVSYTWSKSIDIACSGWFVEGCAVQDPYNFNNERSVSGYDIPHLLTVNWVYELPIGRGKLLESGYRLLDFVLGDWQFNGIAQLRSGQPYGLNVTGDIANTGNNSGYMRPNLVGDHRLENRDPERWFNQAAFAAPPIFTFGNLGRFAMRSDWVRNFDLSLFRQFRLTESKQIEFRAESFNTFNTPAFGAPVGTLNSPNFGRVLALATSPRQLQFSLRVVF